jgi:Thioredoxin reductase
LKGGARGAILVTDWIENYPGFPEGISGYDLAEKIKEQALTMGLNIETAEVHGLDLSGTIREVISRKNASKPNP